MVQELNGLLDELAIPHRARPAYRALLEYGLAALPAIRKGLMHQSADVRYWCCQFLDHFVVPDAMAELVAMLDDADSRVRCAALHALFCDRCKEGVCHLEEEKVLPRAIALLTDDPDRHVRAHAVGLVARWVHTNPDAEAALLRAHKSDACPAVRKRASLTIPGGTVHRRTAPKVPRKRRPIPSVAREASASEYSA
jgi:HEAT repeat protein